MELEPVLKGKYPAKAHCAKVTSYIQSSYSAPENSVLYLEGQKTRLLEDNDEPQPFRQRRHFFYLTGCALPDCHLTYHLPTATLTLFIPPLDPASVMWSGLPLSPEQALSQYDIDACLPSTDLPTHLAQLALQSPAPNLYATGTEAEYTAAGNPLVLRTDFALLKEVIGEVRVVKDEYEIAALRHANKITAQAHRAVREKIAKLSSNNEARGSERELEAVFTERCIALGAPKQAYHGIFGAGENAATLHYVHNDQPLQGRKNVLVDAAAEWGCYCADVTRTYSLRGESGSFDEKSRAVYEIVAEMQARCMEMMKAGVAWEEVHLLAHRIATRGLLRLGILRGASEEELVEKKMSVPFFPHGLGHYLGLDTHDVGGHPDYEDQDEVFRYLRVRGKLPENSVVTVEPGVYFCRFLIEPVLSEEGRGKYIDRGVLDGYWDVGGVRIEDDVVIRQDGVENLTVAAK